MELLGSKIVIMVFYEIANKNRILEEKNRILRYLQKKSYFYMKKNRTQLTFVVFSYFDLKIRIFQTRVTKFRNGWQVCIN